MKRLTLIFACTICLLSHAGAATYNVLDFGAKGDGQSIDSRAINAAIMAASNNGGGTVYVPSGCYLSYSIRLASHVHLFFEQGARLVAAAADLSGDLNEMTSFDPYEPAPQPRYQDFGHSHWKNSLIWGIGLEDVTISGPGYIDGSELSEGYGDGSVRAGLGNKAIALKECRHVRIKDITVFRGGHFALLATGVDDMVLDGISVDTGRDGFDIDCCRNVRISNCLVNCPFDDGIVLKASYALGRFRDTQDVVVTNCNISGYEVGSVLDCTYQPVLRTANPYNGKPLTHRAAGRFKLGTESSGGFKNITLSNCTFEYCGGILVESMDGGSVEDISVSNCTMRDCTDSPIFFRLGKRMRSPEGTPVGTIRRVMISDVNSYNANPVFGVQITAVPGSYVEDVTLRNIHLNFEGGYSDDQSLKVIEEKEKGYPDPWMFGARMESAAGAAIAMPSKGMFLRRVKSLVLDGVYFTYNKPDSRKLFVSEDVVSSRACDITVDGMPTNVCFQ